MKSESKQAFECLKKDTGKIINQNTDLSKQNNNITKQNITLINKVSNLDGKPDVACKNRVVNEVRSSEDMLVVFKNNDVRNKKNKDKIYDYTVKRIMRKSFNKTKKDHELEHPNMELLVKYECAPNAKILWINIKKKLKNNIKCCGGNVNLRKNYTEKQFKKDIKKIYDERLDKKNIKIN